ncbi:MAG: redox-sensing transcriptional repressor Rex [Nitriliruptorales bacterium]|nr:redox-sensing transcriptional repressor Rex [Nitriliruptorales bacterium]
MAKHEIPEATVSRLPVYLQALVSSQEDGLATVSSDGLARAAGVNSAQVRKDLSYLGSYGTRGVGYRVQDLIEGISEVLGLEAERPVVIVGVGNLGRALSSYAGFREQGFRIRALVDADPDKIGTTISGVEIEPLSALPEIVSERGVSIAVLATPGGSAQEVADALVDAGITAILNFAPAHLDAPDGVTVRRVDLSTELQILSFYERLGAETGDSRPGGGSD